MANPKPVPPYKRLVDSLAWVKLLKISFWVSSVIPMPVSHTHNCKVTWLASSAWRSGSARTLSTISPTSVNLTALLIRLSKICCTRKASPNNLSGTSGATSSTGSIGLTPTLTPRTEAVLLSRSCKEKGAFSTCNSLASIFDKSRMSSIKVRKVLADNWIFSA